MTGVSMELLCNVMRLLVRQFGDRPMTMVQWDEIKKHLGEIERIYREERENAASAAE